MKKLTQFLLAAAVLALMGTQVQAQCTFSSSFGSASIPSSNGVTTISTCSFGGEYSTVSGAVAGSTLRFTSSVGTDFITVHSGSPSGPVIAFGQTPLQFANSFTGTVYAHWSTNATCGTQSSCRTTTVQCVSCAGPQPGQCTFSSSFGSATINPNGNIVTISTCSFAGEYSTIFGAVAGDDLKFTSSAGDYATVHAGSPSGPVIAFGTMPLSFNNSFTGTLYVHWSLNSACGTQSSCRTTTVQCISCLPPPAPVNDDCSGAIAVACGGTVSGNTALASPDAAPTCVTSTGTGGALWYKVIGNGGFINASTCSAGTNYDTKLSVYTGSCTGLTCVTGNDDDANCTTGPGVAGFKSKVTWCSVQGQPYWILVHGFGTAQGLFSLTVDCTPPSVSINAIAAQCSNGGAVTLSANFPGGTFSGTGVSGNTFDPSVAGVGTFTITYTVCSVVATTTVTVSAPPTNDACADAIAISCNSSTCGSTTCASADAGLPFCGTSGGSAPGVWYKFTGNGAFVNLTLCNAGTDYDTKLHVFSGACGSLACVAGNDDNFNCATGPGVAGFKSAVSFCSVAGQSYYVLVHGFGTARGNFCLDMSCNTPLAVDAGACQTRFVGYTGAGAPDDTLYICPTVTGGTGPFVTTISPAAAYTCSNGCYAVAPSATTTYTVTTTDGNGCSTSDQVLVQVIDVVAACPSPGQPKVQVCHVPPGNPGNANNICISPNGVPAHISGTIGHGGCYLGPCGNPCRSTNPSCAPETCGGTYTITISGTGFLDETSWSFGGATGGPYAFGSTNSATVIVPNGSSTFTLETQGSFNDNVASYTISCNGGVVTSGTLNGGLATTVTNVCCGGLIAPKTIAPAQTSGISVYPNPFTDVTNFKFRAASNGHASIVIFNMAGKQVATAFDGEVAAQSIHEVKFDATDLSAGMYLYRYTNSEGKMSMGKVNLVH